MSPFATMRTDSLGHCTEVNDRWVELTGLDLEASRGDGWRSAIHTDDREWLIAAWNDAALHREPLQRECRLRRGEVTTWVILVAQPASDEREGALSASIIDISDRKHAETRLAVQNRVNRVLAESPKLEVAARELVRITCEGFDFALVELWWIDEETAVLCNLAMSLAPKISLPDFVESSRSTTFAEGKGLPGRIWSRRETLFLSDLSSDPAEPHRALGSQAGLKGALAIPVLLDSRVLGVAVIALWDSKRPDDETVASLVNVFTQLGQFIERKRVEEAHRRNEELFRYVALATRDAIYDWHIVENVVWRNESYEAIYAPDDLIATYGDWWIEHLHPFDRERVTESLRIALDSGADVWASEYRLKRGDGAYATILDRGHILYDGGRAVRMIGAMTDISARTRAEAALSVSEQALRESEAKYRTLYRETPAMMHSIDENGFLLSVSETWLRSLGYTEGEVIGRASVEFLTPASQRFARDVILPTFFKTGVCIDVPYQMVKKDGSVMEVLLSATAEWEGGKVAKSLAVMVDVTSKKMADEALLASLRDKEVLLRELHHRVKNNLQIISSLLSLQSQRVSDPVARDLFKESQKRVRAMALVHENLYRTHDFAAVDVVQFLRALTSNILRLYGAEANRIALELGIDDVELEVESAIPCALVVNELVTNCLKHAFVGRPSGCIKVLLSGTDPANVRLVIADDGVGMPAHVDAEHTDTLGLDIVRTLVGQLHGSMEVTRDHGTRFEIRFPRLTRGPT